MSPRAKLKAAISATTIPTTPVFAPLTLDALSGRIAEQAGFIGSYVSGGALGYSHAVSEALLTLTELADTTRHITARTGLAVIVDGGVGFGDPVHTARTIWEIEATGAAGIEIEDQVAPKRVSHHRGIEHLVPTDEMVAKIRTAHAARTDPDFLIIARTGAVKNESFEAAVERGNAYARAGADMIMLMPSEDADWRAAPRRIAAPLATLQALDARTPAQWADMGWRLVIDPFTAQVIAVDAVRRAYEQFMQTDATGLDMREVFSIYRTLPELAGLGSLYEIEDTTTEKPSQSDPQEDR